MLIAKSYIVLEINMATAISIQLDERLQRFVEHQQKSKRVSPGQATMELLKTGYYNYVRQLHRQYISGEMTFRRMAKELGLEYRQLYALFEDLKLPAA